MYWRWAGDRARDRGILGETEFAMFFRSKDPKRVILWAVLALFVVLLARELMVLFQAAKTRGTF